MQAFAKDVPRVRGIFFWRKRRVRKLQEEKEAWELKEKERFEKEQYVSSFQVPTAINPLLTYLPRQEYLKQQEIHKESIDARLEERKEVEVCGESPANQALLLIELVQEYMLEEEWCGDPECRKAIKRCHRLVQVWFLLARE